MATPDRGIVTIKPVCVGIHHYQDVYGSVCSADVVGTPPIPAPSAEELSEAASAMIEGFKENVGGLDFVQIEEPLIIGEHKDMRRLPLALS